MPLLSDLFVGVYVSNAAKVKNCILQQIDLLNESFSSKNQRGKEKMSNHSSLSSKFYGQGE